MGALDFDPVAALTRISRPGSAKAANPANRIGKAPEVSNFSEISGVRATSALLAPVKPVQTHLADHGQTTLVTAGRKLRASSSNNFDERATIVEYDGGAPRAWAEALAYLDVAKPPADVPLGRWQLFIDDCARFLDSGWACQARTLKWEPIELFGCDRFKPFARIDRAGLLWLLAGRNIAALTADSAAIATASGGVLTYRRRPTEPGQVLAWELVNGVAG